MSRLSLRALVLAVFAGMLASPFVLAQAGNISLTVDGTDNPQHLLRVHESIPVSPGDRARTSMPMPLCWMPWPGNA